MNKEIIKVKIKKYKKLNRFVRFIYGILKNIRKKDLNYLKCYVSAQLRLEKSLGRPALLTVEPVNICNLKCSVCETGCGQLSRKPGIMKFDAYKNIIDQFDSSLKEVMLYFMGEPFLNKDIYKIIRYTADRKIYTSVCTNGESVVPRKIIGSGLSLVQFQIGGITQEAHERYRVGGELKRTLENLKQTVRLKKENMDRLKNEKYPLKISLGLIVMKHNEHQIEEFENLAENLGVDSHEVINPAVRTMDQARELLPDDRKYWIYDSNEYNAGNLRIKNPPDNYCEWIYSTVTVQVNGDVVPCCRDPKGGYIIGNIFDKNIYEIWNSERYRELRHNVTKGQSSLRLCKLCEGYSIPETKK